MTLIDKAPLIAAQRIIAGFENTVKRFPSEYDFNNEKTDLYGSLRELAQSTACQDWIKSLALVTKANA